MKVHDLKSLIDGVHEIRNYKDQILWFRGQKRADWDLAPSIFRGYTLDDEKNLTNRFRSRATIRHIYTPEYEDKAGWLALMQHYGLPTRLLDWSRSPLVAAYFALQESVESSELAQDDAAIWVLDPFRMNEMKGFARLTLPINSKKARPMIEPAFTDSVEENGKVRAVMAAETDTRMFVQQGCFTIHSDRKSLNCAPGSEEFLKRLIVPLSAVEQLSDEIRTAGFRRGDLFPDLENLAAEMRSSYPPGWAAPVVGGD